MTYKPKIKKALVVLSPDLIRPDSPMQATLINRAVDLARITGCELELFHVCFDASLEEGLLASNEGLENERYQLIDQDATRLAEIATRLKNESVKVKHEVRWDYPRTDAILRKIAQSDPDIVLKHGREHSYLLGLSSNTDWELARRSPAHVWFVNEEVSGIDRIIAAIGNDFGDPADITTAKDYDLLRIARIVGDTFKAAIYPVNAFRVPDTNSSLVGYAGAMGALGSSQIDQPSRPEIVKAHKGTVCAIAKYFNIDTDNVHLCEGGADDVIPNVAKSLNADMIVMGAQSIGRLERLVSSVTVEPVMAKSRCDILIVRERDRESVPEVEKIPESGIAQYDLERAIINPEDAFDSPKEVVNLSELSVGLRRRILQAWEHDVRAEMDAVDEGGAIGDTDHKALDDILAAKIVLKSEEKKSGNRGSKLNRMTA